MLNFLDIAKKIVRRQGLANMKSLRLLAMASLDECQFLGGFDSLRNQHRVARLCDRGGYRVHAGVVSGDRSGATQAMIYLEAVDSQATQCQEARAIRAEIVGDEANSGIAKLLQL